MTQKTPVSSKKVVATIEARMGSTRLPGKMAKEVYPGLTALGAVIERLKYSSAIQEIVVATTVNSQDDILETIAQTHYVSCFRGSEEDVLGRVIGAGGSVQADVLVLATGDCTCISPQVIDEAVLYFLAYDYDLVSNCVFHDSYPMGIDAQVVSLSALTKAYDLARIPPHRDDKNNFEHTNYFIKHHPELFKIHQFEAPPHYRNPELALALDTEVDLAIMRIIYGRLHRQNSAFDLDEILDLIKREPEILKPLEDLQVNRVGY